MFFLILQALIFTVDSQNFCLDPNLPVPKQAFCQGILNWDKQSRKVPAAIGRAGEDDYELDGANGAGYVTGPMPMPETIYDCLTNDCVCNFIKGAKIYNGNCKFPDGSIFTKVKRKEYRLMTDSERELYRQGFLAVRKTIYKELATYHSSFITSPGAHSGPAFLPWHREFLKRMEIGIRTTSVNGKYPFVNVGIPYWDSSIDNDIVTFFNISSKWSTIFSPDLMGSVWKGYVTDGQFAGFQGIKGPVFRKLDQWPFLLFLFQKDQVDYIITNHDLNQMLAATAGGNGCPTIVDTNLEVCHGDTHAWVNGQMLDILTAANDPMFFLHHCFVDYIFEQWRLKKQTRAERATQWNNASTTCYSSAHQKNAVMIPFSNYINLDGIRNEYTDNMFEYQARVNCSYSQPCASKYLFCNIPTGRCVARVRASAPCRVISGVDPCYNSICNGSYGGPGVCVAAAMDWSGPLYAPPALAPVPSADKRKDETCFNRHPCCQFKASLFVCKDPNKAVKCPASCGVCTPTTYTITDDCSNRHKLCSIYKKQGMCTANEEWMEENCRKECDFCCRTRKQECFSEGPSVYSSPTSKSTSPVCFNNNRCCNFWSKNYGCQKNKIFMNKVCPASCSCKPIFNLNSCSNYIKQCPLYAAKGLCWLDFMKENCRRSCGSCFSSEEEKETCSGK